MLLIVVASSGFVLAASDTVSAQSSYSNEGVSVTLSETDEREYLDRIQRFVYRGDLDIDLKTNAFRWYLEDGSAAVVITDEKPQTGKASVEGTLYPASSIPGLEFSVIVADSVEFETEGTPVEYDELKSNPEDYSFELVRIEAPYQQVSALGDAGEGRVTGQIAYGALEPRGSDSVPALPLAEQTERVSTEFSDEGDISTSSLRVAAESGDPYVASDPQTTRYWARGEATVDVVVTVQNGIMSLYVADVTWESTKTTVNRVASGQHDGELVSVVAGRLGSKVSTKQTLLSAARCASDSVLFPVIGCLPIPTDSTVDSGVLYNEGESVYYIGLSNENLGRATTPVSESAIVVGRVVSASEIHPQLSGRAIVVHEVRTAQDASGVPEQFESKKSRIEDLVRGEILLAVEDDEAAASSGQGDESSTDQTGGDTTETAAGSSPSETSSQSESASEPAGSESSSSSSNGSAESRSVFQTISTRLAESWQGLVLLSIGVSCWISLVAVKGQQTIYNRYRIGSRIDRPHTRKFLYVGGLTLSWAAFVFDALGWAIVSLFVIIGFETIVGFLNLVDQLFEGYYEGRK